MTINLKKAADIRRLFSIFCHIYMYRHINMKINKAVGKYFLKRLTFLASYGILKAVKRNLSFHTDNLIKPFIQSVGLAAKDFS